MSRVVGAAYIIYGAFTSNPWAIQQGYFILASGEYSAKKARQQQRRARDAYNASLRDRMQMVDIDADAPRTIALGRVRAVEGVRRRWTSGTNSENLTLVVSFAGHEIDAFETFYFDDVALGLDGSGYVTTEPYSRTANAPFAETGTLNGSGGATHVLANTPVGTVSAIWVLGSGDSQNEGSLSVSMAGTTATLTGGPAGAPYTVFYQGDVVTRRARIRTYLGTATQSVGTDLAAEYGGAITTDDDFAGIALAVVDLIYDPDTFPQGIPNITATFRGAKVYDPRADSTVSGGSGSQRLATPSTWTWSENPALLAYHYARHANGMAVPAAEIRTADVMAAATTCAVSTDFTMRMPDDDTEVVTLPRFRCGITIPTTAEPGAAFAEILDTMAGRWGWAGGTLRLRAGVKASNAWAMDAGWLAQRTATDGSVDGSTHTRIVTATPRAERVNRVAGRCVNPDERYQLLPFPAVQDAALITADGATYALDVEYAGVNHVAHAQHLARLAILRSQAGLVMETRCNLSAYRCELFDVGTVTLPRFGFSAKTFEVTGWRWSPQEGVQLRLDEITDAMFEVAAELTGQDPAPNTVLPAPWDVDQLTGLAVVSNTTALTDLSIISRAQVSWTASTQQSVRAGGQVEVQYYDAGGAMPAGDWPVWVEQGASTSAVIPGLLAGRHYRFRARFVQGVPLVRGPWSSIVLHKVAGAPLVGTEVLSATDAGPTDSYNSLPSSEVTLLDVSVGPYSREVQVQLAFSASVEYGADPDLVGPPTYAASPLTAQVGNATDGWTTIPYGDYWAFESKQASVQALVTYTLPVSTTRVYYARAVTSMGDQPGAAVGINEWTDLSLVATVLKR